MDVVEAVLNSAVRLMVPLLLAALGELISERAGVMNIGLEGYMTAGAFTAFAVAIAGWEYSRRSLSPLWLRLSSLASWQRAQSGCEET